MNKKRKRKKHYPSHYPPIDASIYGDGVRVLKKIRKNTVEFLTNKTKKEKEVK